MIKCVKETENMNVEKRVGFFFFKKELFQLLIKKICDRVYINCSNGLVQSPSLLFNI